jgi:hypothetical protein
LKRAYNSFFKTSLYKLGEYDGLFWSVLTCKDIPLESRGDDPKNSCFTWVNFDENELTDGCKDAFNTTP